MADTKVVNLTAETDPATADVVYMVKNPGGTPLDRKVTIADLFKNPTVTVKLLIQKTISGAASALRAFSVVVTGTSTNGATAAELDLVATGTPVGDFTLLKLGANSTSAAATVSPTHFTILEVYLAGGQQASPIGARFYKPATLPATTDAFMALFGPMTGGSRQDVQVRLDNSIAVEGDTPQDTSLEGGLSIGSHIKFSKSHWTNVGPTLWAHTGKPATHAVCVDGQMPDGSIYFQRDETTGDGIWFQRNSGWYRASGAIPVKDEATGTTHTIADTDHAMLVPYNSASAVAATLPKPIPGGSVTDDFNRADGALGSNWTQINTLEAIATVVSNTFGGGTTKGARRTETFVPNQSASATQVGSPSRAWVYVRANTLSQPAFYRAGHDVSSGHVYIIQKSYNGTITTLATSATVGAAADVVELIVVGRKTPRLILKVNGATLLTTTDSGPNVITSGTPGLGFTANVGTTHWDNFSATGLASSASVAEDGWFVRVKNYGAGTVTFTPTSAMIDKGASKTLATGASMIIVSDGVDYHTV